MSDKKDPNSTQKAYPFKMLDFLLFDREDHNPQVHKALLERDLAGKVPAFFYRHSVLDDKPIFINLFGGYGLEFSYVPKSHNELRHLDHIFSNAMYRDGKLMFSAKRKELEELFSYDYDTFFSLLSKMHVTVNSRGASYSFALFDNYANDRKRVEIEFGRCLRIFYAFDYLVDHSLYADIFKGLREHDKQSAKNVGFALIPALRNLMSRTKRSNRGIALTERVFSLAGISFTPANEVEFKHFLKDRNNLVTLQLHQLGLQYSMEMGTFTLTHKFQASMPPKVYIDNIKETGSEAEKKREKSIGSGKKQEKKPTASKDPVEFSLLEYDIHFMEISQAYGIDDSIAKAVFEKFKYIYGELQNKRVAANKYRDPYRCYHFFLKKEDKGSIPNRGSADNIFYDDMMRNISEIYKLDEEEAAEEFEKFKSYHKRVGNERSNWVASWDNWLSNRNKKESKAAQTGSSKQETWETKVLLENKHQISRLVDAGIRRMLQQAEINPLDVIQGKEKLSDVVAVSTPIPPSMGKGSEMLFEFTDPKVQEEAINILLQNPLANFKRKEKKVVDIDLIG